MDTVCPKDIPVFAEQLEGKGFVPFLLSVMLLPCSALIVTRRFLKSTAIERNGDSNQKGSMV